MEKYKAGIKLGAIGTVVILILIEKFPTGIVITDYFYAKHFRRGFIKQFRN